MGYSLIHFPINPSYYLTTVHTQHNQYLSRLIIQMATIMAYIVSNDLIPHY